MKTICTLFLLLLFAAPAAAAGVTVDYRVGDETFAGYYVTLSPDAPLVVLVHDWDGLTDYEVTRAEMLSTLGYAVFAIDLFGKGVRPTALEDKKSMTGALYQDRARMRALLQGGLEAAPAQGGDLANAVAIG